MRKNIKLSISTTKERVGYFTSIKIFYTVVRTFLLPLQKKNSLLDSNPEFLAGGTEKQAR